MHLILEDARQMSIEQQKIVGVDMQQLRRTRQRTQIVGIQTATIRFE